MTVTASAFYPLVSLSIPDLPAPVLDHAIGRACREFVRKSHCLFYDISVPVVATVADAIPTLDTGTEILAVKSCRRIFTGTGAAAAYLTPVSLDDIDGSANRSQAPYAFTLTTDLPAKIRLYPTPSGSETLIAKCVISPTQTAVVFDSRLADFYLEGVVAFAKHYLFSMPNTPWHNPQEAQFAYNQMRSIVMDVQARLTQSRIDKEAFIKLTPFA